MKHQAQNSIEKMINQNQQSCSKGLILGKYLYSCSTIREEMVRKQIICIGLKKLKQIVNEYKKQVLSEEDLVCAVKSSSLQHRQIELHNNQMQLPSELAYLNRIKQNNQRVLKNKIKQLEGRLIFNQNKQIYVSHIQEGSTEEIRELKRSLQSKDRKIQEYRRLIDNLERKKGELQSSVHKLKAQSEKMKQKFEQDKKKMQKYKFQLDEIKNKQRTSKKIHKCSITHNLEVKIYPSIQFHESKVQQGGKQYQFKQQMVSLYTTNSILRKQLIQMHDLLDEQDSKYQNKLQYLQNKIKKLTQFNSQRLYKQDLNSSTYSTQPINTVTPRKRNSDMIDYKYINKTYQANQEEKQKQRENLHVKKDKSRVIRLADFQIELELGNEHPKRANNIRYKPMQINVQSSSSYNKN